MLALLAMSAPLRAADDDGVMVVEGERAAASASETALSAQEIAAFPALSAEDLLLAMPGLHQSSHGGRGKADQYFFRGFDAVHGADIAVFVEGVPLNEASNIHGHGYLDLHFIPLGLVQEVRLYPGPFRAEVGDFAFAASAEYSLGLAEPGLLVEAGGATDRSGALSAAWRPQEGEDGDFLVAEIEGGAGVGEARAYGQARAAAGAEAGPARVFLLAYEGRFESPGALRQADIDSGEVGFYDAYPGSGGGRSQRVLGGASAEGARGDLAGQALLYGAWRGLALEQNFTGYYQNPEEGDGARQEQQGWQAGAKARGVWLPTPALQLQAGLEGRADLLSQREAGITVSGEEWEERIDADVRVADAGAWAEARIEPAPWLVVQPGARADLLFLRLVRRIDEAGEPVADPQPADAAAPALTPKLSLALRPERSLSFFAAYGRGFRSPEARGVEDGERAPVSVADGVEAGLRAQPLPTLELQAAVFGTWISDELIFDHTAGRFLSSGATRRLGAESSATLAPLAWLRIRGEVTGVDAAGADGEPLPYAPRLLAALAAFAQDLDLGRSRWLGGIRWWYLGARPLPDGFTSQPSLVGSLTARGAWEAWELGIDVDNLLASRWRDGEFVYPSQFEQGEPRSELPALHVTAGDPFRLAITVGRRF